MKLYELTNEYTRPVDRQRKAPLRGSGGGTARVFFKGHAVVDYARTAGIKNVE